MSYSRKDTNLLREWAWLWPLPSASPALKAMAKSCTLESPKPLHPGESLLVATHNGVASLFALVFRAISHDFSPKPLELGYKAKTAWRDAFIAFCGCAPLIWQSRYHLSSKSPLIEPPRVMRIADYVPDGKCGYDKRLLQAVDGFSFGLSFVLAIASKLWNIPLPVDVAALGAVGPDGSVRSVMDVALKTRALIKKAPSVRRVLVSLEDADEARAVANGSTVEIVPVTHVREVLQIVFKDKPQKTLMRALRSKDKRHTIVRNLFDLTCSGLDTPIDWGAVANACRLLLENANLSEKERFEVGFAGAVAMRHKSNTGNMPVPSDTLLDSYPLPIQVKIVAHIVQHCADTGMPEFERVQSLVRRYLVRGKKAFLEHLRLLGAWGRLLSVCGSPKEAMQCEIESAQGFLELMELSEISRPLSSAFRLCGALQQKKTYLRLKKMKETVLNIGSLDEVSLGFLEVAEKGSAVRLGLANEYDLQVLEGLTKLSHLPPEVPYGAMRALIQHYRRLGAQDKVSQYESRLAKSANPLHSNFAKITEALVRLDSDPNDNEALSILQQLDPGPVSHLLRAATAYRVTPGHYIRRFYPY